MPADPAPETHPLLYAVIQQHVAYYHESGEYVCRNHIASDLQKDSQFTPMLEEAGLQPGAANALLTFRVLMWRAMTRYMNARTGWQARTRGKNASWFHEDWGTPEDCRDALNLRLRDRERDEAALQRLYAITETKCGQLGWSFDPQHDEAGALVHVDVWKYDTP